jgi:hypothetical protein
MPTLRMLPSNSRYVLGAFLGRLTPTPVLSMFRAEGLTRPNLREPHILLLRPFRSASRELFNHFWVGACMWQFGQPLFPVDRNTGVFSQRPEFFIPNRPAWKRTAFGYDRLLHDNDWLREIVDLATSASVVVADTTDLSPNVMQELIKLADVDAHDKTIGIYDARNSHLRALPQDPATVRIEDIVTRSIPYDYTSSKSLEEFWQVLASKTASLLALPVASLPHLRPPLRFFLNTRHLVSMFERGSLAYKAP